jgi:hypothetical protein
MSEDTHAFPMDFYRDDPSPRAGKFRPDGYLVVLLSDAEEGARSVVALVDAGFAVGDMKLYGDKEILESYEVYESRRNVMDRLVGPFIHDLEGRDLYLAYARKGASALWVRLQDETEVPKALRILADVNYLFMRYYWVGGQEDFRIG